MPVFNKDLRFEIELLLHRASINILTKYMLDGSLQSKTNTIETSKEEEALKKEYLDDLFSYLDNAPPEDVKIIKEPQVPSDKKLLELIKTSITDLLNESRLNVQAVLSITKHESNYLNSVLNESYTAILRKTGLWATLSIDEKHYLEGFISALKIRYEEPNKYDDYIQKWNKLIDALNGITKECQTFGAPHVYDKLDKLIKIDTIIENFR